MKSEDLLKAIGNIDDKFIEEAAPKINAVNETNAAESNDSAKTDDKKLVEVVKVKPRNTFRIVASIVACLCLVTAVSFVIVGFSKIQPGTSMPSAASGGKAETQEKGVDSSETFDGDPSGYFDNSGNPLFSDESNNSSLDEKIESETSTAPQISESAESSEAISSSTESNYSENSDSDTSFDEITTESKKINSSDVKAIKAGMTYKEIINQLGETANFGQGNIRQYIVDDKLVLPLRFDSLSDVCKKTGEELLKQAIPYKVPERIKDKLNNDIYAVVINDKFISCINGEPDNCCTIDLSDAEIKFENGKTATAADVKPMSSVLISYDMVAESYPGSMHCLKVTILDSNS